MGKKQPDEVYFPKVVARLKARSVVNERGCWVWQGPKIQSRNSRTWYGQAGFRNKTRTVHRIMLICTQRDLKPGEVTMHLCDNGLCCNPDHLKIGTTQQNLADAREKGSYRYDRSHYKVCKRGHEFTPENTRERVMNHKSGKKYILRQCNACEQLRFQSDAYKAWQKEHNKRRYAKKKAARAAVNGTGDL